jgi:hypothetical protein
MTLKADPILKHRDESWLQCVKRHVLAERERCAAIVARHPDEGHPSRMTFNRELIRGCCEAIEARIRSGED